MGIYIYATLCYIRPAGGSGGREGEGVMQLGVALGTGVGGGKE